MNMDVVQFLRELLPSTAITVIFVLAVFLSYRLAPFFFDYRFTTAGIDIVAFAGRVTVGRYSREDIREVRILHLSQCLGRVQFTLHLGNRCRKRLVLVRLRSFPWALTLTPEDPESALRALGL